MSVRLLLFLMHLCAFILHFYPTQFGNSFSESTAVIWFSAAPVESKGDLWSTIVAEFVVSIK